MGANKPCPPAPSPFFLPISKAARNSLNNTLKPCPPCSRATMRFWIKPSQPIMASHFKRSEIPWLWHSTTRATRWRLPWPSSAPFIKRPGRPRPSKYAWEFTLVRHNCRRHPSLNAIQAMQRSRYPNVSCLPDMADRSCSPKLPLIFRLTNYQYNFTFTTLVRSRQERAVGPCLVSQPPVLGTHHG